MSTAGDSPGDRRPIPTAIAVFDADNPKILTYPVNPPNSRDERLRILVRSGGRPAGFVEINRQDGLFDVHQVALAAKKLPAPKPSLAAATPVPPASVIVCTRDRPEQLARCLTSLLVQAQTTTEIIVVDNASRTDASREVVAQLRDPRVRHVVEPRPGLSLARNTGVRAATHDLLLFTDDDVVADDSWVARLSAALVSPQSPAVGCATGAVPSGELQTPSQHLFERRINWVPLLEPTVFAGTDDRGPLYPFSPGLFGTGANFGLHRAAYHDIGPFDVRLGAGRATRGGEDLDYFTRVILAGASIHYEPAAIVWHVHRRDIIGFQDQMYGYGVGFGAYATKMLLSARTFWPFISRMPRGMLKLAQVHRLAERNDALPPDYTALERRGMRAGPYAFISESLKQRGSGP